MISSGIRSVLLQGKNSRHDIVAPYMLFSGDDLDCLIAHNKVRPDCPNGFVGKLGEHELLLGLSEPELELSPYRSPFSRRKYLLYFVAWIVESANFLLERFKYAPTLWHFMRKTYLHEDELMDFRTRHISTSLPILSG